MGLSFNRGGDRLVIADVDRDSFFARAGLRSRDVIVSVDGRRVASQDAFFRWMHQANPREPVTLIVLRDGRRRTVELEFDEAARWPAGQGERAGLGVDLDMRYSSDAIVERVTEGSPADRAGLRRGDRIERFNGEDVSTAQHLMRLVAQAEPGESVEIEYSRRVPRTTSVQLGVRAGQREAVPIDDPRLSRRDRDEDADDRDNSRERDDSDDSDRRGE
jgi:S1-C subfamily serine protease